MDRSKVESPDINECESGLDANWNERKHLVEEEFNLRLEIQALLVSGDPAFAEVRQRELACKSALRRNEEEYEALVTKWGHQITAADRSLAPA